MYEGRLDMKKRSVVLIPILCAVSAFLLLKTVFLLGYVPSASMEPTLKQGSLIVGCRSFGELRTGDIIIFEREGRLLVKRIAAVGGDTIESIVVPEGCYYVLGDNAAESFDSRYWMDPFVRADSVVAKLLLPSCSKVS